MSTRPREPLGWANWRAHLDGEPSLGAIEVGCYTDASPTGQLDAGLGPLQVINTVPGDRQIGLANMAIVLRVEVHQKLEPGRVSWSRTTVRSYTGADFGDEFAALLALALGIRCRSGGMIRNFEPGDERGQPYEGQHVRPYLPPPRFRRAPVLPGLAREVSLDDARELLERYPRASPRKVVALVRDSTSRPSGSPRLTRTSPGCFSSAPSRPLPPRSMGRFRAARSATLSGPPSGSSISSATTLRRRRPGGHCTASSTGHGWSSTRGRSTTGARVRCTTASHSQARCVCRPATTRTTASLKRRRPAWPRRRERLSGSAPTPR